MKGIACLLLAILVPVVIVLGAVTNGWVLSILWGWFIVPTFELPQLSIPIAIGISLVMGMLTSQKSDYNSKVEKGKYDGVVVLVGALLTPFFTLFIGWIVHLFV